MTQRRPRRVRAGGPPRVSARSRSVAPERLWGFSLAVIRKQRSVDQATIALAWNDFPGQGGRDRSFISKAENGHLVNPPSWYALYCITRALRLRRGDIELQTLVRDCYGRESVDAFLEYWVEWDIADKLLRAAHVVGYPDVINVRAENAQPVPVAGPIQYQWVDIVSHLLHHPEGRRQLYAIFERPARAGEG